MPIVLIVIIIKAPLTFKAVYPEYPDGKTTPNLVCSVPSLWSLAVELSRQLGVGEEGSPGIWVGLGGFVLPPWASDSFPVK